MASYIERWQRIEAMAQCSVHENDPELIKEFNATKAELEAMFQPALEYYVTARLHPMELLQGLLDIVTEERTVSH